MADEYGFPNTEEEFDALVDELLGKEPDEQTEQLENLIKNAKQVYARKALSQALGIDFDKLAALIEDNTVEQAEQTEQTESASDSDLFVGDMFNAQDPNGLGDTYKASEFNIGSVIAVMGAEFFKAAVPHDDHTHDVWIDVMGRMLPDDDMAERARDTNADHNAIVTKIIHFG